MMNKKEFTETIMVRLAERCPDFSFETTNVIKRNDEKLIGISLDAEASLLYVATNRHNFMGANLLMNNSFLYEIAEKLQDSFYIIPSSVHELLVLPACQVQDVEELNLLIQNINDTEVILSDRLSYTLYYYDCTTHKVSIAY